MSTLTPEQCKQLASQAVTNAANAEATSEYPRHGKAVHLELGQAYEQMGETLSKTEEDVNKDGNDRETRRARRIARLERRAARLRLEAAKAACQSHDIGSRIPFGQPILVGHHSERRHRNAIERMHRHMEKVSEALKAASDAEYRAKAAAANDSIYLSDEDAPERLQQKIDELTATRDRMKAINAAYRKAKGDIDKMPDLSDNMRYKLKAQREGYYLGADRFVPFESYSLSNIGARIRDAQKRLDYVKARAAQAPKPDRQIGDCRVVENREFQKLELHFPGKPSDEVREFLKRNGFRWVRSAGCWSRGNHNGTEYILQQLSKFLNQEMTTA